MKKRIIKSYFFKNNVNDFFCFSKRSVKYRKQLLNNNKNNYPVSEDMLKAIYFYKFYTLHLALYFQAYNIKKLITQLFIYSYFNNKYVNNINNYKKKQQIFI